MGLIDEVLEHLGMTDNLSIEIEESTLTEETVDSVISLSQAVSKLGEYLDGVYNKHLAWKCNGVDPTVSDISQLYDIYKWLVHDHVDPEDVETISKNVADCLKSFGFNVVEKGVGWTLETESKALSQLRESDETEAELMSYGQKKGEYAVSAFSGDFMEPVASPKTFTDPGKAVEQWFKYSKKYPTCAVISSFIEKEKELKKWVLDHQQTFKEWHEIYHCPYKLDYLLDACAKPVYRTNDKYPDAVWPFDLG